MSQYLISGGLLAAVFYVVYAFIQRTERDAIIAQIKIKNREEENKEINQITEEIKYAKIKHTADRAEYDRLIAERRSADLSDEQ